MKIEIDFAQQTIDEMKRDLANHQIELLLEAIQEEQHRHAKAMHKLETRVRDIARLIK